MACYSPLICVPLLTATLPSEHCNIELFQVEKYETLKFSSVIQVSSDYSGLHTYLWGFYVSSSITENVELNFDRYWTDFKAQLRKYCKFYKV